MGIMAFYGVPRLPAELAPAAASYKSNPDRNLVRLPGFWWDNGFYLVGAFA